MSSSLSKTKLVINGAYRKEITPFINGATSTIELLMFEWRWYKQDSTSDASLLNQCLLRAMRRGVKVRALVNNATHMQNLKELGFDVRTNDAGTLLHSKCIIFDGKVVVMGSHNLTHPAMSKNIESSVILESEEFAKQLQSYFNSLWLS